MNDQHDLEARLQTWLDEDGPADVPERVVDTAIVDAMATRRKRTLPSFILALDEVLSGAERSRPMQLGRTSLIVVVLATTALVASVLAGAFVFQVDRLRTNGPIAFDSDGDIWVYDQQSGDAPVPLTSTLDVRETSPAYSPDGRYLAYWTTDSATSSSAIHVRDGTTGQTIVLEGQGELVLPLDEAIFGWSPDSTRIAAPARGSSADGLQVGIEAVVVFDVATRGLSRIPVDTPAWSFGWSPDGRGLGIISPAGLAVYESETEGVTRLLEFSDDGIAYSPYALTDSPPSWSRDGQEVFVTTGEPTGSRADIWSVAVDEGGREPIAVAQTNDVVPVPERDGDRLVFGRSPAVTISAALATNNFDLDSGAQYASDLIMLPADRGIETIITTDVFPRAAWSPDSRWLVTKSFDNELVLIDLERSDQPIRVPMHAQLGGYSWGPQPP